jgi:O-antigen/teichoic acid export membrane protein
MKKTFVFNLVLIVVLNLLVKPFYILGIEAEIQNRVGAGAYGIYSALISFSFILNILLDLGTTNWNTRKIAQDNSILAVNFPLLFSLRIILAIAYVIVSLIIGWIMGYSSVQFFILIVLAFNQILSSGILFMRSNLTGLHLFKQDSFISVLDRLILTCHMALLLWCSWFANGQFKIEWLVWGQTLSYGLTFITATLFVLRKSKLNSIKPDWKFNRAALRESLPFAILSFISVIAYRADSVLLERIKGAEEAGIFAMGFRFFEALNMVSYLFATLLLPIFAGMLQRRENISPLLSLAFKIMMAGTLAIGCSGIFWNREIISTFYDHHTEQASQAFGWLMAGCVAFSLQYIFGSLITASGNLKILIRIALFTTGLNIVLNIILIPRLGALGSGIANCITQWTTVICQVFIVHRLFQPKMGSTWKKTIVFILTGVVLGWLFSSVITIKTFHYAYSLALFNISLLVAAILSGMLDIKRLKELIKARQ